MGNLIKTEQIYEGKNIKLYWSFVIKMMNLEIL